MSADVAATVVRKRGPTQRRSRAALLAQREVQRQHQKQLVHGWIERFDLNRTGRLEREELAALLESLQDENGYPALIACSALERSDSVHCLRAAVKYLRGRSWDSAQNSRQIGQCTIDHGRATLERISSLEHFKN